MTRPRHPSQHGRRNIERRMEKIQERKTGNKYQMKNGKTGTKNVVGDV